MNPPERHYDLDPFGDPEDGEASWEDETSALADADTDLPEWEPEPRIGLELFEPP